MQVELRRSRSAADPMCGVNLASPPPRGKLPGHENSRYHSRALRNALAPTWLPEIPHDVINGQLLRYHRTDDGNFLLYSVGWNGADDGGEPEPLKHSYFGISKPTGDWMWRYPAN